MAELPALNRRIGVRFSMPLPILINITMAVDDILYAPIISLYNIWFVPQSYHDAGIHRLGEFISTFTPKPVPLDTAKKILLELERDGWDVRPMEIRVS